MKKIVAIAFVLVIGIATYLAMSQSGYDVLNPQGATIEKKELPYDKYGFDRLVYRDDNPSDIKIEKVIAELDGYISYSFSYMSEGRKISGAMNIPNLSRLMAVVVMARGYVDKEGYETGMGTKNAAAVYATNGYITLAPDFSGYGESDMDDTNALGARLVKPVEILDLLASIDSLPQADLSRVYLWGHSNGGQIMLSVAEILGKRGSELPGQTPEIKGMTLWAPMSKPFPYGILYYSDEADDKGKWLRGEIARFESEYDVYNYSIDRYLDWIDIPIQIHQGSADEAVPQKWSGELVASLKEKSKDVDYFLYPGADHNLRPAWDSVVARDLSFFSGLE